MAKGMLIKTKQDVSGGSLKLVGEISDSICVMENAGSGQVKLTISIIIKDAEIADHDTTKIEKTQAFLLAANEKDVKIEKSVTLVQLEDTVPGSGKLENLNIQFAIRADKGGKVGGPGI